jgi:hypothetical protein
MAKVTDKTSMERWWNDTNTGENPVPVQLYPPQILHVLLPKD